MTRTELIKDYLQKVKAANKELTKKKLFKDLLHRLYHGEKEIEAIIDAISAGSERTILNILRHDKNHKGSPDTSRPGWCFSFTNRMNGEEVFTTF